MCERREKYGIEIPEYYEKGFTLTGMLGESRSLRRYIEHLTKCAKCRVFIAGKVAKRIDEVQATEFVSNVLGYTDTTSVRIFSEGNLIHVEGWGRR